jgi:hypothetical protein
MGDNFSESTDKHLLIGLGDKRAGIEHNHSDNCKKQDADNHFITHMAEPR